MAANSTILSGPRVIWDWYIEYLVYYEPGSWVAKIASTCRVLAFLSIVPFIFLGLLDVASYIIARTLGVIDDTKASTSDTGDAREKTESMLKDSTPTILVQDESSNVLSDAESTMMDETSSESSRVHDHNMPNTLGHLQAGDVSDSDQLQPTAYFVTPAEEEGAQLSGIGVFSPAASRPSSPTMDRRKRDVEKEMMQESNRNVSWQSSLGSISGESEFAMVDRDSSPEESDTLIRRRTRGEDAADESGQ